VTEPPEPTFEQAQAELEQIELTALDQAIGDGDHGANMKRGFEAVLSKLDAIGAQPLDEALKLWERGEELYAFCRARLDAAEGRVEELARRAEQSRPAAADAPVDS